MLFSRAYGLYIGSNNRAFFRYYGIPDDRLFWVPYCVDNATLGQQSRELRPLQPELQRDFGMGEHCGPVILFVGKLVEKKQPRVLLEAFRRVRMKAVCSLLFVGDGPLYEELSRSVKGSGIPNVHFAGFLVPARIGRAFAASDIFVLPSARHETWGLVINEAMNFSLAPIVSDKVGCAPDLVRDGLNGYVFPHDNLDRLTEALESLVVDRRRRLQFGERSRVAVSRFNYRAASEGIAEACQQALRN
jgi:glycosyltransferase involved in cell wall biosynthesis